MLGKTVGRFGTPLQQKLCRPFRTLVIISKTLTAQDLDAHSKQRSVTFENDLWQKMLRKKLDMSGYCR